MRVTKVKSKTSYFDYLKTKNKQTKVKCVNKFKKLIKRFFAKYIVVES